jgi:DNA-binding transcriptional MerR regulator
VDTIRHYERLGVLPKSERTDSGYRIYSSSTVRRVQLAQRALRLGFTLTELSEILRTRDNGGVPCHNVLKAAENKLLSLGQQIRNLQRTQRYMHKLVREWRKKLKGTAASHRAMLLESFAGEPPRRTKSSTNTFSRRPKS